MKDFSGQGKVYLADRDANGKPLALRWVGDASALQVALSATTTDRQESFSGNRLPTVRLQTAIKADLTLTLNYFSAKNIALGMRATEGDITTGTVTAEAFPASLASGDSARLDHRDVSEVVITDATTSTPKTLAEGTDYTLDAASGMVTFTSDLSGFTQPFAAAYSYAASVSLPLFTGGIPEKYLVLDGINTVDNSRVRAQLYRCVFDPASQLDFISNDLGQLELKGSVLYDSTSAADASLGGFGKIELATET